MILKIDEKVHILHRKQFDEDFSRHFVGTVEECEADLVRVVGYLFAIESTSNKYIKHAHPRTRIVHLGDNVVVNLIPPEVDIEKITYVYAPNGDVIVSDGSDWKLILSKTSV